MILGFFVAAHRKIDAFWQNQQHRKNKNILLFLSVILRQVMIAVNHI